MIETAAVEIDENDYIAAMEFGQQCVSALLAPFAPLCTTLPCHGLPFPSLFFHCTFALH